MGKLFVISIIAIHTNLMGVSKLANLVIVKRFANQLEATGYGYEEAQKEFKNADGWHNHAVNVVNAEEGMRSDGK